MKRRRVEGPGQRGAARRVPEGRTPPRLTEKRWVLVTLIVILALGGALRGLYLAELSRTPDFTVPFADADFHNYWARALAFGDWTPPAHEVDPHIREIPYFRPPAYAYFLAAVYKMTGPGYVGPRVFQMALGLLNAFVAFLLARRFFGNMVGLVVAAFMAAYWPLVYAEADFEEPVVSILLVLALAATLARWARRGRGTPLAFGAGALLGVLALVRPNALLLVLPAVIWASWIHRTRGERHRASRTAAALVVGTILLVSPATIRNYVVARDFVPISSNGGINLFIGNREGADGLVKATFPGIGTLDTCFDHLEIVERVERNLGRPMKHSEVSSHFVGLALEWIRRNPGDFVKLLWKKTLLFWGPVEVGGNRIMMYDRAHSAVLSWDPLGSPLPFGLALAGALLFVVEVGRRKRPLARAAPRERAGVEFASLALALIVVLFASHLPFAIHSSRYRAPILPFVFLFGAFFVQRFVAFARARDLRSLLPWGVVLALALVVAHTDFARTAPSLAQWHYQNGIVMNRLGRLDDAIAEYRKALELNPGYLIVMNDLGAALGTQGKIDEALPYLVRVAQALPEQRLAQYNAALALEMVGDSGRARTFYLAALSVDPDDPDARAGMVRVEAALGAAEGGVRPQEERP